MNLIPEGIEYLLLDLLPMTTTNVVEYLIMPLDCGFNLVAYINAKIQQIELKAQEMY